MPRHSWGALDEVRQGIWLPLQGETSHLMTAGRSRAVELSELDASEIRTVLEGIVESYSGAAPWVPLSMAETASIRKLVRGLSLEITLIGERGTGSLSLFLWR